MTETATDIGTGTAVRADESHREYGRGSAAVRALRGVTVAMAPGTFTAVMGPSGSGRTTLPHCLAGMDRPTRGSVRWGGTEVSGLPERRLAELRRSRIGFVFQAFNLMPAMTVSVPEDDGVLGQDHAQPSVGHEPIAGAGGRSPS